MKNAVDEVQVSARVQTLRDEHARLEARLKELDRHVTLTSAEELERANLKKLKLRVKDELHHLSR